MNYNRANSRSHRGPGPIAPPPSAPGPMHNPAQAQEDQRIQKERREKMKRVSKQPTDRHIPDELATVVIGEGVQRYEKLRDAERRLDALMMRRRLDAKDNAKRAFSRREGTLRVWISNTADGQPWQVVEDGADLNADGTFDFENDNNSATYRVKIEGRLLEDPKEEDDEQETDAPPAATPKFSSFFQAITIDFNRNPELESDNFSQIAWRKQPTAQHQADPNPDSRSFDLLEFERKGDENINITVNLVRDQDRLLLSPPLADLLDTKEDDMAGIIQGIWEYARAMNLQEDEDKRTITCDEALARVFNAPKIGFPYLPDLLSQHVQPLPPIKLKYTIRVDKAYIAPADESSTPASQPTVYDIRVPLPNTLAPVLQAFNNNKAHVAGLRAIIEADNDIALLVAKINQTNAKRKFFDNLSKDPAGFVQRWIGSQKRDLEVIMAEATRGGGEDGEQWRKGGKDGVWGSDVARESVGLWLARSGR